MKFSRHILIVAAVAILMIALIVGFQASRQAPYASGDGDVALPDPDLKYQELSSRETDRLLPPDKKAAARVLELARLKKRWLEVKDQAKTYIITPELQALATESAEALLCSNELLRLLEYLDGNDMANFADVIRDRVPDLFDSDHGPEARKLLADLTHRPVYGDLAPTLAGWCYRAAFSADEEEFEAFRNSLGSQMFITTASFGWNVQLAKSDPADAMTSTLNLLASGEPAYMQHEALPLLINNIPDETNFAEIEALLPPPNSEISTSEIEKGRSRLLVKWAHLDPAAAANFVIGNPERADPSEIKGITMAVLERGSWESGLEWVEHFPPGPYLDYAARAVVVQLSRPRPEEAQRYAAMIENEELREQSMTEIQKVIDDRGLSLPMEGQ